MRRMNDRNGRCNVLVLVLVVVIISLVRNNVGTFSIVEDFSMCPNFRPNDVIRATIPQVRPQRGDVVIVSDDRGDRVLKRIIGLPGDTVTLYRGFIYIDRQRMYEPYLPEHTYTFKNEESDELPAEWQLGADEYFVLGDNRFESRDSRDFGAVDWKHIMRVVNLPGNEPRPGFRAILLLGSGTTVSVVNSLRQDRSPNGHQTSEVKI